MELLLFFTWQIGAHQGVTASSPSVSLWWAPSGCPLCPDSSKVLGSSAVCVAGAGNVSKCSLVFASLICGSCDGGDKLLWGAAAPIRRGAGGFHGTLNLAALLACFWRMGLCQNHHLQLFQASSNLGGHLPGGCLSVSAHGEGDDPRAAGWAPSQLPAWLHVLGKLWGWEPGEILPCHGHCRKQLAVKNQGFAGTQDFCKLLLCATPLLPFPFSVLLPPGL